MGTLIRAEDVCRDFNKKNEVIHAVNHVTLHIEKGTFNILCGRSGSGKTTLLNMIAAIDLPTSGSVFYQDTDVTKLGDTRRDGLRREKMGIVFQNTALIAQMTAVENVEFALSIAGTPRKQRRPRSISWLERLGIRERRNHMPAEMSGGEQARVAIARSVAHEPELLLADEPTAELDSRTSFKVVELFRELVRDNGLTIVMTTHDVNIMDAADRIYTMEDGVITDVRQN